MIRLPYHSESLKFQALQDVISSWVYTKETTKLAMAHTNPSCALVASKVITLAKLNAGADKLGFTVAGCPKCGTSPEVNLVGSLANACVRIIEDINETVVDIDSEESWVIQNAVLSLNPDWGFAGRLACKNSWPGYIMQFLGDHSRYAYNRVDPSSLPDVAQKLLAEITEFGKTRLTAAMPNKKRGRPGTQAVLTSADAVSYMRFSEVWGSAPVVSVETENSRNSYAVLVVSNSVATQMVKDAGGRHWGPEPIVVKIPGEVHKNLTVSKSWPSTLRLLSSRAELTKTEAVNMVTAASAAAAVK